MKMCATCKEHKSKDEFGKDRSRGDGLNRNCKVCERARAKRLNAGRKEYFRRYRQDRQEHYNALARAKYAANPPPPKRNPERKATCEYCGATFITTDTRKKYCTLKCGQAKWNFDKRAKRLGAQFTKGQRHIVFERDNWTCQLCFQPLNREAVWPDPAFAVVDHIVPLSKGGTHGLDNWQAAHNFCNSSKLNREAPINTLTLGGAYGR